MRVGQALTVRIVAGASAAAIAVGLSLSAPRLKAQQPASGEEPKAGRPADPPPTLPADPASPGPDLPPVATPGPGLPPAEPDPNPPPSAAEPPRATAPHPTPVLPSPSSPPSASSARVEDPEAAAEVFVERSRREADESVQALAKEAESLRARLRKVEAGLARWQAVKEALEANAQNPRPSWKSRGDGESPEVLEPLPRSVMPDDEPAITSAPRRAAPAPSRRARAKPVTPREPSGDVSPPLPKGNRSPFDLEEPTPNLPTIPPAAGPDGTTAPAPKPASPTVPPPPPRPSA